MLVVGSYQTVWGKLHKTSFLKKNKIKFPNTRANEDVVFNAETVIKARRMAYIPEILYHYRRVGQNSTQNNTIYTKKGFNLLPIFYRVEKLLKDENIFNQLEINFLKYKINESKIRLNSLKSPLNKEFYILLKKDFIRMEISKDKLNKLPKNLSKFYMNILNSHDFNSFINNGSDNYEAKLRNFILRDSLNGNYLNLFAFEKFFDNNQLNTNYNCLHSILDIIYDNKSVKGIVNNFDDLIYKLNYPEIEKCHINPFVYHILFGKNENKYKINKSIKNDVNFINKRILERKIRKFSEFGLNTRNRDDKIIVSLTSFPERIDEVKFTIFSLLNQKLKPDKVILWLANDEFINKENSLPNSLLKLIDNGLSIKWYDNNIKSYKKLIPSLKMYSDSIIVTVDDDIYYPKNWLFNLFEEHKKFPQDIICARSKKILLNSDNEISNYKNWEILENEESSSFFNFFTGSGGVLYPQNSLNDKVLNENLAMELCPYADDIWFWSMAILNKTKIKCIDENLNNLIFINPFRELNLDNQTTLWKKNVIDGKNDIQLKKVFDKFPELYEILGISH